MVAGCPCTHPFYSELLLRKSKPYGLANLSFRFIGVGGANYLTTVVRNTKIFGSLWNARLCYAIT
jgi:hypothetical protein